MRYLLYGYYGHGNFGDDLLLRALVEGIAKRDPAASCLVYSFDPTPPFDARWRVRFLPLARHLENIRRRPWRLLIYLLRFCSAIRATDTFVIGGGALFLDKGRFSLSLALLYLTVVYARLLRHPVVLVGGAVVYLELAIDRWLTRRIFAAASFVAVREAPSLAFAPPGRAKLAADLALGLEWRNLPAAPSRSKRVIGLCFIDYYRTVEHSPERHRAYETAVRHLIERHRDRYDFAIVVLQRNRGQRDDWIESALGDAKRDIPSITVSDSDSADELARSVDLLVTTRFHLGLLGAMWEKPVIVVDHEAKMEWLASALALPSISMADFIAADKIDLDRLFARYNPMRTRSLLEAERKRAAANFDWLAR